MAKDLTPEHLKCATSMACPGVFELEPEDLTPEHQRCALGSCPSVTAVAGDLLIVGKRGDELAKKLGKGVGDDEYAIVIERGLLGNIGYQANDSVKGERSSASPLHPSDSAEADRWHFDAEEIGLLPCPFCGPGNSKVSLWRDDIGCGHWQVNCGRCGGSSGSLPANEHFPNAKQRIIDGWNTRNGELRSLNEGCKPDERTAAGESASLTPNSTPQEAPAGPGDDNAE